MLSGVTYMYHVSRGPASEHPSFVVLTPFPASEAENPDSHSPSSLLAKA